MSDNHNADNALPATALRGRRGISAVWLLPLFAVILGIWLAYKHFNEAGVAIVVKFPSGEGVQAGKTEVRYKGIKVGVVDELNVQPDLQSVAAHITVTRRAESALREDTQFWLVKPELSLGGVQGLETLVSGNYIAVRPGQSQATRYVFTALEDPPPPEPGEGDLRLKLTSPDVGSLHSGSPIHYRKLRVGEIVDYTLSPDHSHVVLQAHIDAEHAHLVNTNTRFWNTSGVSISGDLNSIEVNTDSLTSIILGGLSFDVPPGKTPGEPAQNDAVYTLYPSFAEADTGIEIDIEFPTAEGLKANHTEIRYKGMTAGKITQLDITDDFSAVIATASIDPLADVLLNDSTRFWQATPSISLSKISGLSTLLTGTHVEMAFSDKADGDKRSFVALPEAPPPRKDKPGVYIELTAKKLDGITRSSELYYRNIGIGEVIDFRLSEDRERVILDAHIRPDYSHLITERTRFYHNSGVDISAGLDGVNIHTESLSSILRGGIGLYLSDTAKEAPPASTGARFALHESLEQAADSGPMISIQFADGDNLKAGADLKYLGVTVGQIDRVELNHPDSGVTARVEIDPSARHLITRDTQFWRVKPQINLKEVTNLGTLIFGQYLAFEPGESDELGYEFVGRETPPEDYLSENGLTVTLQAPSLASIKEGRSVFYREIPIGQVTGFKLADNAQHVNIYLHIDPYYAPLVKSNSVFWNATGIAFDFGWFSGAELRTGSVQSLLAGGIAMATPDSPGANAADGDVFSLHDVPQPQWQNWAPDIPLKASN